MNNHFIVSSNSGNGWIVRRKGQTKALVTSNTRRQAESQGRAMARKNSGIVSFRNARGHFAGSVNYS